jgi:hypothetical protein
MAEDVEDSEDIEDKEVGCGEYKRNGSCDQSSRTTSRIRCLASLTAASRVSFVASDARELDRRKDEGYEEVIGGVESIERGNAGLQRTVKKMVLSKGEILFMECITRGGTMKGEG